MNLQAQAEREIPNDQLTVMLAVEEEGKEAAKIANKINQDMDWALKLLSSTKVKLNQVRRPIIRILSMTNEL